MPVSKATIADIPQLNYLINSAYRGEISQKGWTSEAHLLAGSRIDEAELAKYLADPAVTILKCTGEDGEINGSIYLELRKPQLYVGMLSVFPLLQGAGIGKQLLLAAEDYARQAGYSVLTMTVISTRHELIAWYERRGYQATGEIKPFPTETKFGLPKEKIELMVMEKVLGVIFLSSC